MAKAIFNGVTVAESDDTVVVEGNHYFPRSSLREELFSPNDRTSVCPWKGTASYLDVVVEIKDRVAFWGDVKVEA